MLESPKLPRIAAAVAFLEAAFIVLQALAGPIIALPLALIPLCAGIGILRRRVSGAIGFAIYLAAGALILPLSIALTRNAGTTPGLPTSAVGGAVFSILFFAASRSMRRSGASPGSLLPWILIALILNLPVPFIHSYVIPTGSMEDTIMLGDRILARTFPIPKLDRGQIVVVIYPIDRRQTFIKRIVGIGGDKIRISRKALFRNGTAVAEPYVLHKSDYEDSYRDDFPSQPNTAVFPPASDMLQHDVVNGELVVPQGRYFVLGDNRDYSLDSRYWGFIEATDVIGIPFLVYDSEEQDLNDDLSKPPNLFKFHKRRWNRILKPL